MRWTHVLPILSAHPARFSLWNRAGRSPRFYSQA